MNILVYDTIDLNNGIKFGSVLSISETPIHGEICYLVLLSVRTKRRKTIACPLYVFIPILRQKSLSVRDVFKPSANEPPFHEGYHSLTCTVHVKQHHIV
jgi:hypothetical protein